MFVTKSKYNEVVEDLNDASRRIKSLENTLQKIIAQETSHPNATVTRILNLAKQELPKAS